jgi:hypothetical protein
VSGSKGSRVAQGIEVRKPKEHGAWAMLYVPLAAGVLASGAAAGKHVVDLLALLGAATGLFLGRESLLAWLRAHDRQQAAGRDRFDSLWQLGGAAACGAILLARGQPVALWPLALGGGLVLFLHILQMRRREGRTVLGEVVAILGLTLAAPAANITALGEWSWRALVLWMLCALFFSSSVLHIKARVLAAQPRRAAQRAVMRRASGAYHLMLGGGLVVAAVWGGLPILLVVAFAPVVARALIGLGAGSARPNLLRAGLLEIAYSVHFLVLVTLALR